MEVLHIPKKVQADFEKILISSQAVLYANDNFHIYDGTKSNILFDLDMLWHHKENHQKILELLIDFLKESKIKFDVIVAITSQIGSFGPVPLASDISLREKKTLVVFVEAEFGKYYISPMSLEKENFFQSKKVLVLKDVVLGGRSIIETCKIVSDYSAQLSAIVTLVDFGKFSRTDIPGATDETKYISLLTGPKFSFRGKFDV